MDKIDMVWEAYGVFFSAKEMSPSYKVLEKDCWPALL